MDLKCLQDHMKGKKLLVNGTSYAIDVEGYLRDVKDADSPKLLSMTKCWVAVGAVKPAPKGKDPDATLPSIEPMVMAAEERKLSKPSPEPVKEEVAAEVVVEEEWPDPKETMAMDYLQQMADAYEVSYDGRMTKKTLVKRIREAMYE